MMKLLVLAAHFENDVVLFELLLPLPKKKKSLLQAHSFAPRACGSGNSLSFGFDFVTWCKKKHVKSAQQRVIWSVDIIEFFANNQRLKAFTQAPRAAFPPHFAPAPVRVMSLMLTASHSQHVCQAPPPPPQTLCSAYCFNKQADD